MRRRSFLTAGAGTISLAAFGQKVQDTRQAAPGLISAGTDRYGEHHTLGVSQTDFKVVTTDARGGLFIMEHTNRKKGGPPRHLHHNEDEWFYAIEGDYVLEVGGRRIQLKAGDSALGPRGVPHTWAFVGETPGKMLIAFAPANKMEEYFRSVERSGGRYSRWDSDEDKELMRACGMELLGPPLLVG